MILRPGGPLCPVTGLNAVIRPSPGRTRSSDVGSGDNRGRVIGEGNDLASGAGRIGAGPFPQKIDISICQAGVVYSQRTIEKETIPLE